MKGFIINADDYGMALEINDAIERLLKLGCISSTSIMVNMPYVEHIARLLLEVPDIGVGVHLTLSQGKPLSPVHEISTLVDKNGDFFSYSQLIKKSIRGSISFKQCKLELRRQILRAKELTDYRIDHWNSHKGIHRFEPLMSLFLSVCSEMKIPAMRTPKHYWISSGSHNLFLSTVRLSGGLKSKLIETYYLWLRWRSGRCFAVPKGILVLSELDHIDEFINRKKDWDGVFEIVCHPATSTSGLGQTSLLSERVKEYETLTKPEIVKILAESKKANLLITFRDLQSCKDR